MITKKLTLKNIFAFFFCFSINAQEMTDKGISSLDWMIGKWSVEAAEDDSDKSSYKERGFLDCSWVLNGKAIRCDRYVSRLDTSGRYKDLPKSHSSIIYFIYNKKEQQYEGIRIGASGTRSQRYTKQDQWTLKAKSSFIHPTFDFEMFIDVTHGRVNPDLVVRTELLTNEDGSFTEGYEETMKRIE